MHLTRLYTETLKPSFSRSHSSKVGKTCFCHKTDFHKRPHFWNAERTHLQFTPRGLTTTVKIDWGQSGEGGWVREEKKVKA